MLEATISSISSDNTNPMMIDFSYLTKILECSVPNEAFVLQNSDYLHLNMARVLSENSVCVVYLDKDVCAETLCEYCANKIQETLKTCRPDLVLVELRLKERAGSYAVWKR